jgi:hypothetical protein
MSQAAKTRDHQIVVKPCYQSTFSKSEKLKGRDHLGDLVMDGMITLKWISRKWSVKVWTALIRFKT